jgi:hypothetical protein
MTDKRTSRRSGTRRLVALLAFAGLCAALTAAIGISTAGAKKAVVLGKTKTTPKPACPDDTASNPCTATGRVTGFMTKAAGRKHPYNIFQHGKIVAWSIDLSKPTKDQYDFFGGLFENDKFGTKPSARIAIIKSKGHHKFKLLKQSPAENLKPDLGVRQTFTLRRPLGVHKGNIVALSLPTWATAFSRPVSATGNQWKASRKSDRCNVDRQHLHNAKQSKAQQKVGSVRPYGCTYSAARLLYWAYFVPSKKK